MKKRQLSVSPGCHSRFQLLKVFAGIASLALNPSLVMAQPTIYGLGTTALVEGPAAGSNTVVLGASGAWRNTANVSWLHLDAANQSGTGSTNVLFSFDANSGASRTGTLTIAGQPLTITQAGSNYIPVRVASAVVDPINPTTVAVDFKGDIFATSFVDDEGDIVDWWAYDTPPQSYFANTALDDGNGLATTSIAVDGAGNLYDADQGYPTGRIVEWFPATDTTFTLVSSTNLAGPASLAVDASGNAFIVGNNGGIYESSASDRNLVEVVSPNSDLVSPTSLAVDNADNLYILDGSTETIKEWMPANSNVITLVSNLIDPRGLVADGSGNVYFADAGNNTLEEWTTASGTVTILHSNLIGIVDADYYIPPVQLAISPSNNVYVAAYSNSFIFLYGTLFVDPTPALEGAAAGHDVLPAILPIDDDLAIWFPPSSDQPWLTIDGMTNGVISFSFGPNTTGSARTANISLHGQGFSIPVTQYPPPTLTGVTMLGSNVLQFSFTNSQSMSFTVLSSTNLSFPLADWAVAGTATNVGAGMYQFTSAATPGDSLRFYALRSP